ncbi:hypothetical protein SmJEL517_g03853 [Synchytrium microbalum]|uniref:Ribosomal protein n=1 Tax=Synchytrium microbalum TaxID=1806994 RepID=A0A507C6V4_9FUNG|nr:uncharacterized protein SmJEL517_g03853 [Synchytrium microbalum]TPX33205.1 hypothetical protein SmJEL517_g03853 [Synchytrium microbalum]
MNSARRVQVLRILETLIPSSGPHKRPMCRPIPSAIICQVRYYDKRHYQKQKKALKASRNQDNITFADAMDTFRIYCLGESRPITLHTQLVKAEETTDKPKLIRGDVTLPHLVEDESKTSTERILVFARGDDAEQAKKLGAAIVGAEDLFPQIQGDLLMFDKVLCTKELFNLVIQNVARHLGPKGLMPSPGKGTVGDDLNVMFKNLSRVTKYEADEDATISVVVGNTSWSDKDLFDNTNIVLQSILVSKPTKTTIPDFIKSIVYAAPRAPGMILPLKPFNLVSDKAKKETSMLQKLGIIVN